jgi:hypothetical protein
VFADVAIHKVDEAVQFILGFGALDGKALECGVDFRLADAALLNVVAKRSRELLEGSRELLEDCCDFR